MGIWRVGIEQSSIVREFVEMRESYIPLVQAAMCAYHPVSSALLCLLLSNKMILFVNSRKATSFMVVTPAPSSQLTN